MFGPQENATSEITGNTGRPPQVQSALTFDADIAELGEGSVGRRMFEAVFKTTVAAAFATAELALAGEDVVVDLGLGRIVALHHRSSTLYQIH
jgi:hypothetical protein